MNSHTCRDRGSGGTFEELVRIEGEARDLCRRLVPEDAPDARYQGSDPTGMARVAVDGSGMVRNILINGGWRRRLSGEELGAAVQQATVEATTARLVAWGEAAAAASQMPAPPAGVLPETAAGEALARTLAGALAPNAVATERLLSELLSMVEQASASIDSLAEQEAALASSTWSGVGRAGRVCVTISGAGEIVDIEYDQRWLATATAVVIGSETCQAFVAAYDLVGRHSLEQVIAASPLGEIQRLAADPTVLLERLGLPAGG